MLILLISCALVAAAMASALTASAATAPGGAQKATKEEAAKDKASKEGTSKQGAPKEGVSKEKASKKRTSTEGVKMMLKKIHWLGHDCFRIDAENVIYFDPLELKQGSAPADIIFITHEHFDHCSPEDVAKIQKKGTVIVTTADCAKKLSGETRIIKPGDTITVKGVRIEAVPAYNIDKKFHPKDKGWVGYVITVDGTRIYHAGDTDFIPEMKTIKTDIAFIPVSGTYVMTADEAAKAAEAIKPQVAIPMHYGSIIGSDKDAVAFKQKCTVPVEILKSEK
jgi:L-ascorbate metabolism protein UlaG (beta-lactamase superfamily)